MYNYCRAGRPNVYTAYACAYDEKGWTRVVGFSGWAGEALRRIAPDTSFVSSVPGVIEKIRAGNIGGNRSTSARDFIFIFMAIVRARADN